MADRARQLADIVRLRVAQLQAGRLALAESTSKVTSAEGEAQAATEDLEGRFVAWSAHQADTDPQMSRLWAQAVWLGQAHVGQCDEALAVARGERTVCAQALARTQGRLDAAQHIASAWTKRRRRAADARRLHDLEDRHLAQRGAV